MIVEWSTYRLEYYAKQQQQQMKRVPRNHQLRIAKLDKQWPEKMDELLEDAKFVLAYYPEVVEYREKVMVSLAVMQLIYTNGVLDNLRHLSDVEYDRLMRKVAKYQLSALRMLHLVASQDGDGSRWRTRAKSEINRFQP